ncbi:MAG: phasin family protein [Sphingomonadales bacterium]|nr:phasin family protein [Sphingomonadales bacterium]
MASEAKIDVAKAEAAAEKAYAAAAEKVEAPKAEAKPAPVAPTVSEAPKVEVVATPVVPVVKAAPAPKVAAKAAKTAKPKRAVKKAATSKAPVTKTVKAAAPKAAAKPATKMTIAQIKETIMTTSKTTTEDFTAKVKEAVTEAQDRAKVAFEKGQVLVSEANEFTKGNVEALVESGKILAAGLQELGKDYVAEGKSALETAQADLKDLAAVKSPADFFKLQGEILRRNFDAAVASGSKHSEAVLKLANETFAPISTRVSVAVEKVKKAA